MDEYKCRISTGICGAWTFGSGQLDNYGYWELPCPECALEFKKKNPNEDVWPEYK